ncbi:MAG: PD40 domain-containing protein [Deltaproteobacteria bacterium]|nr:PD40 domain-containing protein [Deltaproteobacteria bacterium]
MRAYSWAVLSALLAACGGSSLRDPPRPPPEPEVSRGPVQLLVERFTRGGTRDFYLVEPDGSRLASFPAMPREVTQVVPSPDGRTLAQLVQQPTGEVHLWLADRDGRNRRPLLEGDRWVASVAWSPDSTRLAVSQTTLDTELDVWVVGADGTGLADLTPDPDPVAFFDANPSWSPDGTRIVFSSNRGGTYSHLYTVAPAGGAEPQPVLAVSQESMEHHPAWSPDGRRIAFLGGLPGTAVGIGLVEPGGMGYTILPAVGRPENLAWSPDGRILYASAAGGAYDIQALDPSTGLSQNLTDTSVDHEVRAVPLRAVPAGPWRGFGPLARYESTRPPPLALAGGDVEADGATDLVSLLPTLGQVRVHQGTGGGALHDLGSLDAPAGPRALLTTRVDRDGAVDLAALGATELWVWRGGPGGPGTPAALPLPGQGRALVAGDFSWTGTSQLASLVEAGGGAMRLVLHGLSGAGELGALLDADTGFSLPGQACAGDVTGEGSLDIVATTRDPAAPVLLLPTEGISFAVPVVAATGVEVDPATPPICADLDGDRRADAVLLRPGVEKGLAVLRSTGAAFAAPVELSIQGVAMAAGDVDQDGDVDLIVAQGSPGAILFLRNLGDGRFAAPATLATGGAPRALALADLDGDGLLDLAVADADGSLATWRNLGREVASPG